MRRAWRHRIAFAILAYAMARPAYAGPCEDAGQAAEQKYGLPTGLLRAIGQVESGRWDPVQGRTSGWPWSVDVDGAPRFFDNPEDAIRQTEALRAMGHRSVDVGCFQISLLHHPAAFHDMRQAFDPGANADYAARFLASLKVRFGTWLAATAAYHSTDAALGLPYRDRVMAAWSPSADITWMPPTIDATAPGEPVVAFGVRVWGPSRTGSASAVVALPAMHSIVVPRIITP
jgi:hypothetical protein